MQLALEEAHIAAAQGEVPVGAVVVRGGRILGRGHNQRERLWDVSAHAEILALRQASQEVKDWRLGGATVYVTLEPCSMCTAALGLARVERIVFGADDPAQGACGSFINLADYPGLGYTMQVVGGCLAKPSADLLSTFFAARRT
jgi:tRNA(adenine34) deaminase